MQIPDFLTLYFTRHLQVALNSLGRLVREPIGSLMTVAVIAIALALPSGLYLLTGNLQRLSTHWDGDTTISLFLKQETSIEQATSLTAQLNKWNELDAVQLITPDQAL